VAFALATVLALVAFAANSLLCRLALGGELIDPLSFTAFRLSSGALALAPLAALARKATPSEPSPASWGSALALFVYAIAFSLAYVSLEAGVGALILFGAVQLTMTGAALRSSRRLGAAHWIGTSAAAVGLVFLVSPGLAAPDPLGAVLMGAAGVAWGIYSLRGLGASAPIAMTSGNFARAAPLALAAGVVGLPALHVEARGALLAVVSGAVTSGLGYVLWYAALRGLSATRAGVVQLAVPVLAAFGGIAFLSERLTLRLVSASLLVLGGIGLVLAGRRRFGLSTPAR
jgi:drug/metabolite transporter (DMT)-like permease